MKIYIIVLTIVFFKFNLSFSFDENKYAICYGEMTNAHKARGLHQSNREMSIKIKETVCKAYAEGEDINYEGKGKKY